MSFSARWSLMVNGGSSRQEGEEKHVLLIVRLMTAASQHVRHAAFRSNVSAVIQVTSQLRSWVASAAPNASVMNEDAIVRIKKKKSGKYFFYTHQQSNGFSGCLRISLMAATSAAFYLLCFFSYHLSFGSFAYISELEKSSTYADDVLLLFCQVINS